MFRQRLLTTLVLMPIVLFGIYLANKYVLASMLAILLTVGGWEWLRLIPVTNPISKSFFLFILVAAFGLSSYVFFSWLFVVLICWSFILIAVLTYPKSQIIWGYPAVVGGLALLLLPLLPNLLMALSVLGEGLVIYLFFLVWAADIGAYIVGKLWGRHKLIPKVSPGKTIEGSVGGLSLVSLVAIAGYYIFMPPSFLIWLLVALVTGCISVLGDLFISMLKRRCRLKDTGNILPGHGGILDRLDSLIAALPVFYIGMCFVGFNA